MIQPLRDAMAAAGAAVWSATGHAVRNVIRGERALLLAAAIALLCVVLQGAGLVEALRFDRTRIAAGAWWRLLSGNFVHLGASHLAMNLAGLALVVALVWRRFGAADWALITLISSLLVGAGLYLLNPGIGWYVGFSGTLHGLLVAGSLADLRHYPRSAGVLLALLAGKLLWEQYAGALPGSEATAGGRVVVDAHLYGAVGGLLVAPPLLRYRRRRARRARGRNGARVGGRDGARDGGQGAERVGARDGTQVGARGEGRTAAPAKAAAARSGGARRRHGLDAVSGPTQGRASPGGRAAGGRTPAPRFERRALEALGPRELFELARLRVDVFVVEQACPYPELDDLDVHAGTRHVLGRAGGELIACARTMVPPAPGEAARVGRVAVRESRRGEGVARRLMDWTLAALGRDHPDSPIVLGAQLSVERFYASFGFERASDEYLEDGIAHVEMLRPPHRAGLSPSAALTGRAGGRRP